MTEADLGVVIVTYNSADVIAGCLESLFAAGRDRLRLVVVDNASTDDTLARMRGWADGVEPFEPPVSMPFALLPVSGPVRLVDGPPEMEPAKEADLTLLHSGANRGFAGGVNVGLSYLAQFPEIRNFWILNPDSMTPSESVAALTEHLDAVGDFALLGGRLNFLDRPDRIQIDGGLLNRWTGVTGNYNLGRSHRASPPPDPAELDFIMGASMVASRAFYEAVGPMREDYFLYYEEVDWAMRRGDSPLAYCPGLVVYHWGGTAIGSPVSGREASVFSIYFKHRSRMRFLRRFNPLAIPVGLAYSVAIVARLVIRGRFAGAWTVLAASFGGPVPRTVRDRLGVDAQYYAFASFYSGSRAL